MPVNSDFLTKKRTHAIGRILIDLPVRFEMRLGSECRLTYGLTRDFFEVTIKVLETACSLNRMQTLVRQQIDKLITAKTVDQSRSLFDAKLEIHPKAMIVRSLKDSLSTDDRLSEAFILIGDSVLVSMREVSYENEFAATEARLARLSEQISATGSDLNKLGRGFVLGPILINGDQDQELGDLSFELTNSPEVNLSMMMRAPLASKDPPLLTRFDSRIGMLPSAAAAMGKTLDRGSLTVADQPAQYIFGQVKQEEGQITWTLDAEVQRNTNAWAPPLLDIFLLVGRQVEGGQHVNPKWTQDQAKSVLMGILNSIKVRPGSV